MQRNQTVTRRLTFCAGHRVKGHEGKCKAIHGHSYIAYITVANDKLDNLGRIIDFGVLKAKIGTWLDSNFDHAFIVWAEDGDVIKALSAVPDNKTYILPYNPTAENIARYLAESIIPALLQDTEVYLVSVKIDETENCSATVYC